MKRTLTLTLTALVVLGLTVSSASSELDPGSMSTTNTSSGWIPVALMHGISAGVSTMDHAEELLKTAMPGIYVLKLSYGDDTNADSWILNMDVQVADIAAQIQKDPNLANGFNLVGMSQGGMDTRGYIQRYNNPPVLNYVSWVAVQAGIFGIPDGGFINPVIDDILGELPYSTIVQEAIAPTNYWKDPFHLDKYLNYSLFLADINNEREVKNPVYKENFSSLKSVTLLYSEVDEVLIPRETGWFNFYAPNSTEIIVPWNESALYTEDWIGLKILNDTGRLFHGTTQCSHGDYSSSCFDEYFNQYCLPILMKKWDEL